MLIEYSVGSEYGGLPKREIVDGCRIRHFSRCLVAVPPPNCQPHLYPSAPIPFCISSSLTFPIVCINRSLLLPSSSLCLPILRSLFGYPSASALPRATSATRLARNVTSAPSACGSLEKGFQCSLPLRFSSTSLTISPRHLSFVFQQAFSASVRSDSEIIPHYKTFAKSWYVTSTCDCCHSQSPLCCLFVFLLQCNQFLTPQRILFIHMKFRHSLRLTLSQLLLVSTFLLFDPSKALKSIGPYNLTHI
jgi:hypothetical protein